MKKHIQIGKTRSPHGIKGALKFHIDEAYVEDFFATQRILIDMRGTKLPYRIKDVQAGNALIVHLAGINDRDAALALSGKEIFLREKDVLSDEDRSLDIYTSPFAHLEGFTLKNESGEVIGTIEEVREMPGQDMAILNKDGNEIMVPLVEQLIIETDVEAQEVKMDLPEGLFDL